MRNILIIFSFSLLLILGVLIENVNNFVIFPISELRLPLSMPSTPVIQTPSIAWALIFFAISIEALAFYNGLPRTPPHQPIRKRSDTFGLETSNYGEILDLLAAKDDQRCLSRFLCHIGAMQPQKLTFMDRIIFNFVVLSGSDSPEWNYSNSSLRRSLVEAANYGQITKCMECCQTLYHTCTIPIEDLVLL